MRPLGAATYGFLYRSTLEEALTALAELGMREVELTASPPHLWPAGAGAYERLRLARRLRRLGLTVVSVNPTYLDLNLVSLNPAIREATLGELESCIELCHDLQGQLVVVIGGRRHGLLPSPLEDATGVLKRGLERLLRRASALGVRLGLEAAPSLFLERTQDVVAVIEEMADPGLRLVFDSANVFTAEDPLPAWRLASAHAGLVHLSDTTRSRWTHGAVGTGDVPFPALAEAIALTGYAGPSVLEVVDGADPAGSLARSVAALAPLGWGA